MSARKRDGLDDFMDMLDEFWLYNQVTKEEKQDNFDLSFDNDLDDLDDDYDDYTDSDLAADEVLNKYHDGEDEGFDIGFDQGFDAASYFGESFGVMIDEKSKPERVVIRAYGYEPYYLRDLPLHHSQRELSSNEEYTDFELKLRPAEDFIEYLLSLSTRVRLLEPAWLVKELQQRLRDALSIYK